MFKEEERVAVCNAEIANDSTEFILFSSFTSLSSSSLLLLLPSSVDDDDDDENDENDDDFVR
jgi:hypothetical protein